MKKKILTLTQIAILIIVLFALTGCGKTTTNEQKIEEIKGNEIQDEEQAEQLTSKGGSFVKYNGYTYYWKLSANSREKTALFGEYNDILNYENDLIKMDEDGNEEVLMTYKGSGDIFIVNDKIFLTYSMDEYGSNRKIYSVDLNGKNMTEYAQGEIKCIVGDYLICQTKENGDIYRINTKTEKMETLKEDANILGCINEVIYYAENYDYTKRVLKIGSINGDEDNGIIATFSTSEFKNYSDADTAPIEITEFWEENNKLNMYVGYRLGTANNLQELIHMKMDKNGQNVEKEDVTDSDEIFMESEQVSEGVYFKTTEENGEYFNNLMYVDETTKERKEIMTEAQINEKFDFLKDDEHITVLYNSSIIDNDIYIILDYGKHYSTEDIGWRYSYKREKTVCFKYNTKTEEITKIYEF